MREVADSRKIRRFMRSLGEAAKKPARVYFTGGATAVLIGWRPTTIDVDLCFYPEQDELFQALPRLKERLQINVELACPSDFIPEVAGWEARSLFVESCGKLSFYHYDPYSQVLAKIERSHRQDLLDVGEMLDRGLVEPKRLEAFFDEIEGKLYRYPAIDPESFRRRLQEIL